VPQPLKYFKAREAFLGRKVKQSMCSPSSLEKIDEKIRLFSSQSLLKSLLALQHLIFEVTSLEMFVSMLH